MALALMNGVTAEPSQAATGDQVTMRASQGAEGGRLLIEWLAPIKVLQKKDGNRLMLRFSRPLSVDTGPALGRLAAYLNVDQTTIDGTDFTLMLKPGIAAKLEIKKQRLVAIDLSREQPNGLSVKLNVSRLQNGMRLSFHWPRMRGFKAQDKEGRLLVTFNADSRISPVDLRYLNDTLQPWFSKVQQKSEPASTSLAFDLRPMIVPSVRGAGENHVVIDLIRDASALKGNAETNIVPAFKPKLPEMASALSGEKWPPIPERRPETANASIAADKSETIDKAASHEHGSKVDELVFDWESSVGAAVFKRAGYLWIVFDALPTSSKTPLPPPAPPPLMAGEMMPADKATVIRFRISTDIGFDTRRDERGRWVVRPDRDPTPPDPVSIMPASTPGILHAVASSGGRMIDVEDPLVGDRLSIWTIQQAHVGQQKRRRFVDLEFLPSIQGLVWRPFNDGIVARSIPKGIEFSSERGLALSRRPDISVDGSVASAQHLHAPREQQDHDDLLAIVLASEPEDHGEDPASRSEEVPATPAVAEQKALDAKPSSYLDLVNAGLDRELVAETRRILRQAIGKVAPEERDQARLRLARLLVAERLASEAKIVLNNISEKLEGPIAASKRALHGASAFLTGDLDEASQLLRAPEFDEDDEIGLWRAALDSIDKDWQTAAQGWKAAGRNLDVYPSKLRLELGLLALESAIETNDDAMIRKGFRRLKTLNLQPYEKAKIDRLHALSAVRDGDLKRAKEILQTLTDGRYAGLSVLADFELMSLSLSEGSADPRLLAALHDRLPLWRGHPQEIDMIDRLARRYRDAREPREALSLWEHLAKIHPETEDNPVIRNLRHTTYAEAINELAGQEIGLLDAYSIYLDFIDLLPAAPKARIVHRSLARHLAGLDLLNEAVLVLQPLLESATDDVEEAEIGAEMATLLLSQGRPGEALSVLDRIGVRGRADLGALEVDRHIMKARALTLLDRDDEALTQIQDLQTSPARHIRAEIFWKQRNWSRLAAVIGSFLNDPALSLPLRDDDQKLVLWLALAREQSRSTPSSTAWARRSPTRSIRCGT